MIQHLIIWELICLGPFCDSPPNPPFEEVVENIPKIFPKIPDESCNIVGSLVNIKCPSFLNVYVSSGYYGRVKGTNKLCNGNKDAVTLKEDCLNLEVNKKNPFNFFSAIFVVGHWFSTLNLHI